MKLISSIKHQALVMFVSLSLALTVIFFALAVIAAFVVEDKIIFQLLKMEASHIERVYAETGSLPESRLDFVDVFASKKDLPDFVINAIDRGGDDNEVFTPTDEHYHYQELYLGEGQRGYLVAEVSPLLTVTTTTDFYVFFIIGLVLALVIGVLIAYRFASQTVKPVMELTKAIKHNQPLPVLRHELGYLSATMKQAIDGLSKSLQREKDFTTDVNHELRTPLTILNNIITLAEQRGLTAQDLSQLRQLSKQMQHTIEVLLALARAESLEMKPCLIASHIEQVAMQCITAQNIQLDMTLDCNDDLVVNANPVLLDLLLTNLITNAINHGKDNVLTVHASDKEIVFRNSSNVSAPDNITHRGIKGRRSTGVGQGLYLVTRIAELLGWRCRIEQTETQFSTHISL